jgi:hypothetical protein
VSRADWPVRRHRLGEEPPEDLSDVTTAEDRLRSMWPLAREGWLLAGRSLADYDRAHTPTRIFRPHESPPDDE